MDDIAEFDFPLSEDDIFLPGDYYNALTEISYKGKFTPAIKWRREDDTAIATFGHVEDAAHFVHGFLDFWKGFKMRDTEETERLRGKVREDYLPKRSLADEIEIPTGVSGEVKIRIPLNILDMRGLMKARTIGNPEEKATYDLG